MAINHVSISGNLVKDAEFRATASGVEVLIMRVAVNSRRKNPKTEKWEDVANFFDCSMFGSRGEKIKKYLTKGTKVYIDGKLRSYEYQKDDEKRSAVEIMVDEIEFSSRTQKPEKDDGSDFDPELYPEDAFF